MLQVTGKDKDTVGNTQRWYSPAGTVIVGWDSIREIGESGDTWRWEKSWTATNAGPNSLRTGQKVGLSWPNQREFAQKSSQPLFKEL